MLADRSRRVLLGNQMAEAAGIRVGMSAAAACALTQGLVLHERDESAEQAALARLAAWLGQFSSLVSLVPPVSVLLEVGGSRRLFGGLDALLRRIDQGIDDLGYEIRMAVAPTPLAAQWLARFGSATQVTRASQLQAAVSALPAAWLENEDRPVKLASMGVRTIGECLRLPRAGLARRLGPNQLKLLDQLLGRAPDPRPAYAPPSRFEFTLELPAEVEHVQALLFPLQRLLPELAGLLNAKGEGVQQLHLLLLHHSHPQTELLLRFAAPTRDADRMLRLARERLAALLLPAPVRALRLTAGRFVPLAARSDDFFGATGNDTHAVLLERLQARLGETVVRNLTLVAEHRPEHACRLVAPVANPDSRSAAVTGEANNRNLFPPRPLWLLSPPRKLQAPGGRPVLQGVLRFCGQGERIESGWWDGGDVARDYYVMEDGQGGRYWVFREHRSRCWFLHGVFA